MHEVSPIMQVQRSARSKIGLLQSGPAGDLLHLVADILEKHGKQVGSDRNIFVRCEMQEGGLAAPTTVDLMKILATKYFC